MSITRRLFFGGLMTLAVTPPAFAVSDGRALFWSAEPAGQPRSVLFGYERVAATRTADIVRDGERLADDLDRLIGAMPNMRFAKVEIPRKDVTPLVDRLSRPAADRVRDLFGQDAGWKAMNDTLSGVEFVALIMFEGQTPATASVAGTIAAHALGKGKPISYLLSQTDLQDMMGKPDLAALDKRIDERIVTWLLDLHDRIGAVGRHFETLYSDRRSADIQKFVEDMRSHGMPSFNEMGGLQADKVEAALATRTAEELKKPDGGKSFFLLPLGTLCDEKSGVLAKLKADGVKITPIA